MRIETLTSPEVRAASPAGRVVVLPLGSFEQHGPHLPLTTDTDLVTAIARALEKRLPEKILLLPTLWTGHSTHHLAFPGTLNVRQMPYIQLLIALAESVVAMDGTRLFLLNGHGGNGIPAQAAMREIKSQFPALKTAFAAYWTLAAKTIRDVRESPIGGIGHACELETSLMLHLYPEKVHMDRARNDGCRRTGDPYRQNDMQYARPACFVSEFHEVTGNGTVGQPELATAEKGRRFFEGIIPAIAAFVEDFAKW
ncbi:MAG: creatininase family protein [Opitutaceae bacterium]|jgi:creatinine amidohydrolase|nr:creatininase family protein [Opitutaceae bacterium]